MSEHENPVDVSDVTDAERASMLEEYLEAFADEFGEYPRLMPLDDEGKAPIISGRCRLHTEEAKGYLVDGVDAIDAIREDGARGYALYAGNPEHRTEEVVFVDHDDDEFPTPTGEPTLEVLSGSGRGKHETYRNAGDVANARVGDNLGEIRAENWYVVTPGSVHPSGGVYHITHDREIATLADGDLDDSMRPATATLDEENRKVGDVEGEGDRPDDEEIERRLEKAFNNSHDGDKIKNVYDGNYKKAGFGDRSEAEFWLACRIDSWVARGDKSVVEEVMNRANLQKWPERPDRSYRDSIMRKVGYQDWYYDPTVSSPAPSYDSEEVERGTKILEAECTRTSPAGEMVEENGHYGYWEKIRDSETGEVTGREFKQVTNFTLETLEHLETDKGALLKVRVHPAHPHEEEYEVDVHPTVFNETRTFKEEIVRGRTTRYEPGKYSQTALNDLRETVGSQLVPKRVGVEHIGLAGDEYDEWVTPKGTLSVDGPAEDPEHRYYAKGGTSDSDGGALARKWNLDPDEAAEYDEDTVAKIVELLPRTRKHDRGLPVLGWFYAAPLRPLVHDWEGEFNLLQVVGSTGTGKTSTLKAYWEALGMDPDPFSASATPFTLMKHMASSSGIPVWIDEYKPADIRNDRLDTLHRRLRETTKGGSVSKGMPNLGETLFTLKAPVVVSGEQKFGQSVPAVRRRAVMTTLSSEPTREGTEYRRAFSELTGTPYEDETGRPHYPEGYDLSEHAAAYYRYILSQDKDDLRELWNETRERAADILSSRGLTFQKTEFQGAQTILFGVSLFREFADTVGADPEAMPTDEEVADAFEHYASNIGKDGKRMGYDDSFLELFAQAASKGYLERDEDFRFMDSQKFGGEVLAFHMPTANAAVRRYVREFNLDDEYTLVGKDDYLSALRDKTDRPGSHVHAVNHAVRLDGGRAKCVLIDPHEAGKNLGSGFDLRAFDRSLPEESERDHGGNAQPAADGGSHRAEPNELQRLKKLVNDGTNEDRPALRRGKVIQTITERFDCDVNDAESLLEKALERGFLQEPDEGEIQST